MSRVELRKPNIEDKDVIFNWISNPELRKMTGTRGIPNPEGHSIWFNKKIKDTSNELLIIENEGKSVGIIGTNDIDELNGNAEMYLYVGEQQQKGKGIATAAVNLFVREVADRHKLHKITARIFSFNIPSIRLFEKCGFVLEGRLREQIYQEDNKEYADLLWYGYIIDQT